MPKRPNNLTKRIKLHQKRLHRIRKHPFVVPVVTFLVLFFITLVGFVALNGSTIGSTDSRVVKVYVDGKEQTLPTRAATVGELLSRLDIQLDKHDVVEPTKDTQILSDNFTINVYRSRPITVVDGNKKVTLFSASTSLASIAKEAGVKVYPEDSLVTQAPDDSLREGVVSEKVVVERATPVYLNLYGKGVLLRTHAKTVGDLLKERGIQTQPKDTVHPSLDTPLKANSEVFIVSNGSKIKTIEETIAPPVKYVDDPNMPLGVTEIREQGQAGKRLSTYTITVKNGKEASRKLIQTVVVIDPIPQVVSRGTKLLLSGDRAAWLKSSGIDPSQYGSVDFVIGHESGWRPSAISGSGCAGLGQSCPVAKLATICPSWQIDPVCQLNFFDGYARSRYGSWSGAASYWSSHGYW